MACGQHTLLACTHASRLHLRRPHHQPLAIRPLLNHSSSRGACCSSGEHTAAGLRAENKQELPSRHQDRTRSVATHAAAPRLNMSLVLEADSFTHILRIMSTNVDGKRKVCPLSLGVTFIRVFVRALALPIVALSFFLMACAGSLRLDCHPWSRPPLHHPRLQEGRCQRAQAVRRVKLFIFLCLLRSCIPASPESFRSAGELKPAEIDKVLDVIAKPEDYKVRQSRSSFTIARAFFRV